MCKDTITMPEIQTANTVTLNNFKSLLLQSEINVSLKPEPT